MTDSKNSTIQNLPDMAGMAIHAECTTDGFVISRVGGEEFTNNIGDAARSDSVSVVSMRNGFVAHLVFPNDLKSDCFRLIDLRRNPLQSSPENWKALVSFLQAHPDCLFAINDTPMACTTSVLDFLHGASEMIGSDMMSVVSRIVWIHDDHFKDTTWHLFFYKEDGFDDSIYGMFEKNHTIARNIFREIDSRIKNSAK